MEVASPWMAIRDFNYVLKGEEHSSGNLISLNFVSSVDGCGMIGVGFFGPRYAWNHGIIVETHKSAR